MKGHIFISFIDFFKVLIVYSCQPRPGGPSLKLKCYYKKTTNLIVIKTISVAVSVKVEDMVVEFVFKTYQSCRTGPLKVEGHFTVMLQHG